MRNVSASFMLVGRNAGVGNIVHMSIQNPQVSVLCVYTTLLNQPVWDYHNNKTHKIPKLKCFLSRLAVVFVQYIEAKCWVENEDVDGAAPTGSAPTTSEWSTI